LVNRWSTVQSEAFHVVDKALQMRTVAILHNASAGHFVKRWY
jgi:hypothetical protein